MSVAPPSPSSWAGITDAPKPFDSSATKSDVVLRSKDFKYFHVLKDFLSYVSPVFDAMFSSWEGPAGATDDGKPIIQVEEHSTTLYNLLLFIYPLEQPCDVDACIEVAKAANKYDMGEIDKKIREVVRKSYLIEDDPLQGFAIAVSLGWEDIMKVAAYSTLGVPLRDFRWYQELESLSAGKYHKLLRWRFACHDAVDRALTKYNDTNFRGFQAFHNHKESKLPGATSFAVSLLRSNLATTGCPQSKVLLDETTKNTFLRKYQAERRSDLYTILESLEVAIDEALSKVPLDIKCNA
ncbi:hypothetical protein F5887DRAFT_1072249 [Amanita rubescens]|nr:hypothetical protein F5887DRAFT_1072249 [Amanita rubescens]